MDTTKEPEIELFVKVGLGGDSCSLGFSWRLILPGVQLGVGSGDSRVSSRSGSLEVGTKFGIAHLEGWLSGCPEEGPRRAVARGPVRCHAQHPRRCPGLAVAVCSGEQRSWQLA